MMQLQSAHFRSMPGRLLVRAEGVINRREWHGRDLPDWVGAGRS
ncbi:hypothetical protein ACFPRL_36110 [Pseudoclavibacter helvolus]